MSDSAMQLLVPWRNPIAGQYESEPKYHDMICIEEVSFQQNHHCLCDNLIVVLQFSDKL